MVEILKGGQSPANETDKLVTLVHGLGGAGKSAFGLSYPSPIYMFNCDRQAKSLIAQLPDNYEVHYEAVQQDVDGITHGMAAQYIMKFDELKNKALAGKKGTLFIDGFDIFWEYVKLAKVPGLSDESLPRHYEPANGYMFNLMRRLIYSPLDVVLTTISERPWEGQTRQADYLMAGGWKHRDRFITAEVYMFTPEHRRRAAEAPLETKRGQSHSAYIGVSKLKESLVGSVIPNLSYKMLYRMTFNRLPADHELLWTPGGNVGQAGAQLATREAGNDEVPKV